MKNYISLSASTCTSITRDCDGYVKKEKSFSKKYKKNINFFYKNNVTNEAELLHLYKFIMETKWDINISAMAKQMYQYSGIKGDYESEKKMLLLILDTCEGNEIKKWFDICKNKLYEEDWQNNYENIFRKDKEKGSEVLFGYLHGNRKRECGLKISSR